MSRRSKPDPIPVHLKFGYERVMEERAIRQRLLDEGHADDFRLHFKVSAAYDKAHENDIPWREKQKVWAEQQRVRAEKEAALHPKHVLFTLDEMLNILARFDGANDVVGQSIMAKVTAALPKDETDVSLPASS